MNQPPTAIRISAVVITFNEQDNIARCIESLHGIADEILVVDSFSTDETEAICKSLNVRFLKNRFEGHIEQKNFAMTAAAFDHVLSLDADEMLSADLRQSVLEVKGRWNHDAYSMNRLNNYCGTWIRHGGWYPDRKIRLWDRRKGKWDGENPHDRVIMTKGATTGRISADILHYSYKSYSDHLIQLEKFSTIAATEAFKKKRKVSFPIHVIFYPWLRFIQTYFFRLGFLDGTAGFTISVTDAFYRFSKYTKLLMLYRKERAAENQ